MKKRILTWLLAISMLGSLLTVPAGAAAVTKFSDVSDSYIATAVETLRLMGVLDGYSDGTFRPNAALTRAQFCKMAVYAMDGSSELGRYSTVTIFPDVKPSHWAASYINLASKGKAIILGFADGYFRPDSKVTYAQAVTILMRQLGYTDADVGGLWPAGYLAEAESIGLTRNLAFTANAALTRQALREPPALRHQGRRRLRRHPGRDREQRHPGLQQRDGLGRHRRGHGDLRRQRLQDGGEERLRPAQRPQGHADSG